MLCHLQSAVAQELLQRESVAAAVQKVLSGKCMTEQMDACLLDPAALIVIRYGFPQSVLCQKAAVFIRKEIIRPLAAANLHVLPQDHDHPGTDGDRLELSIFRVPENDLRIVQRHIRILDVPDRCGPTACVHEEGHDDPAPKMAEGTGGVWPFQELHQFFVGVGFLHRLFLLDVLHGHSGKTIVIAPIQERAENAEIAANRIVRKAAFPHPNHELIQVLLRDRRERLIHVQKLRHGVKMISIISCCDLLHTSCRLVKNKLRRCFRNRRFLPIFHLDPFHAWPHASRFLLEKA